MSDIEKNILNSTINIPAKFVLTNIGENYFIRKKIPMRDIITKEGRRTSGFIWEISKTKLIEKFIVSKLIDEINIERVEFNSKIKDTEDFFKLVFYSLLYKKFKPELSELLFNSGEFEKIKKDNPQIKNTSNMKFNVNIVYKYLNENKEALDTLKEILSIDAYAIIDNDKEIIDKEQKKKIINDFIDQIEPDMWFLFHFLSKSGGAFEIVKKINELIINYLMKSKIADNLSKIINTFIDGAEGSHISRLAKIRKTDTNGILDIERIINDENIKNKLLDYARKTNTYIYLLFKFQDEGLSTGKIKRLRMQIYIIHKGDITTFLKKEVKKASNIDNFLDEIQSMKENNIKTQENNIKQEQDPIEISLKELSDECEKEKMKFVSNIDINEKKEETSIMMTILL